MKPHTRNAVFSLSVIALVILVVVLFARKDAAQESVVADVAPQAGSAHEVLPVQGNIEGVVWQAFELNAKPLADGVVITLELKDGRIAGRSACNRYTGPYEIDTQARSLKVTGPVAGTRMACMPDIMDVENAFTTRIDRVTAYRVDDGPVLVIFAGTDEFLRLKPQAAE